MSKFLSKEVLKGAILPALAIGESIISRGASPGTASLGVIESMNKSEEMARRRAIEEEETQRQREIDALNRQLKQAQLGSLKKISDPNNARKALLKKKLELAGTDRDKIEQALFEYQSEIEPSKALEYLRIQNKERRDAEKEEMRYKQQMQKEEKQREKEEKAFETEMKKEKRENISDRRDFRKDFVLDNRVRTYQEISGSFDRMKSVWESRPDKGDINGKKKRAAIDQAMITLYNKMLDPGSVVRESEFARTPENVPKINKVVGYFQQLQEGGAGITDADRKEIYDVAKQLYSSARDKYKEVLRTYYDDAEESEYDVNKIFPRRDIDILTEKDDQRQQELQKIFAGPETPTGITPSTIPVNTINSKIDIPNIDMPDTIQGISRSEIDEMTAFIRDNPADPRAKLISDRLRLLGVEVPNALQSR
jgi:hypothetical protein